jgi:allantoinase
VEAALPFIVESGLPLLVHAELAGPIDAATDGLRDADWRSYATYLASRPDQAELEAIRLMIRLCRQYRFRLHIVHLSTALALEELQAARAEGLPITVETCPHYLHFAAEEIPDGSTLLKCAPPIRSKKNQQQLWHGLRDGIIDMIVTDHSPCPPAMKREDSGRFDLAWGGIAGLSLALSVIHTKCSQRGFALNDIVRWMTAAPATLAGMSHRVGAIEPGRDANFVIFDTDLEFTVTADRLHYRHKISPYLNETLRGAVKETYLRGQAIYRQGSFAPKPSGRELTL